MERARELIEPYLAKEGVIGIYVLGSSTRPFRDHLSDYDIEVIVEDGVYAALPDEEKHVFVIDDGPPRHVDHEFYLRPMSEFLALGTASQDLFHYPYQHAVVLHDPEERLTPVIARLAQLPPDVRRVRMRVHFLEFLFALGRARKTGERSEGLNLELLYGSALAALIKLLFLVMESWPATAHWSQEELNILGVDESLLEQITTTFASPTHEKLQSLVDTVKAFLSDHGETFQNDHNELMHWAFITTEGKRAFNDWGAR